MQMGQASTVRNHENETDNLPKERNRRIRLRSFILRSTYYNLEETMTTFYRGIKVDGNIAKDKKLSKQGGVYRGIKHGAIEKESVKVATGMQYRGIKQ